MDHKVVGFITWFSIISFITCLNHIIILSEASPTIKSSQDRGLTNSSEERTYGKTTKFSEHRGIDWVVGAYEMHLSKGIRGVHGKLNVWQPNTTLDNFSGAEIQVVQDLFGLSAGWTVNPRKFHDMRPRVFASHMDGDYYNICYTFESNCTAFVMTRPSYFTCPIQHISTNLGPQYEIDVKIIQDRVSKNWSLQVNGLEVGYWVASMVSYFENGASVVSWVGRVASLESSFTKTEMGSGKFPEEGYSKASYIREVEYIDNDYLVKTPTRLEYIVEQLNDYRVSKSPLICPTPKGSIYFYYGGSSNDTIL